MNLGLGPDEGRGMLVVAGDEGIDVIPELADGCEAGVGERAALQDGEPDLDLVQPRGIGRGEVEMDIGMAGEPALALMGREIPDDDVDLFARLGDDDLVHEIEELDAPAAPVVAGRDLAGGDLEGGTTVERDRMDAVMNDIKSDSTLPVSNAVEQTSHLLAGCAAARGVRGWRS